MAQTREELVKEFNKFCTQVEGCILTTPERLANLIIADRKRICEPLTRKRDFMEPIKMLNVVLEGINETLRLAGLGE